MGFSLLEYTTDNPNDSLGTMKKLPLVSKSKIKKDDTKESECLGDNHVVEIRNNVTAVQLQSYR